MTSELRTLYAEPNIAKLRSPVILNTALLRHVTDKLASAEPDWEHIRKRLVNLPKHQKRYLRDKTLNNLVGKAAELHVRITLEDLCDYYDDRVMLDPIPDGARTPHYFFQYGDAGNVHVRTYTEGSNVIGTLGEFDALILADVLPTVVEVKLTHLLKGRGTGPPSDWGLNKHLRPPHLSKMTDPLREYFGGPCGYVMVMYPEVVRDTPTQQTFKDHGGIIVPWYTTKEHYVQEVETAFGKLRRKA